MKKNLLTIGEVSKLTGCSIKSLRYYDSIGLLKPVYVDSHSNYRYYNFDQTRFVDVIQFCILLGIPLKEVKRLITKDNDKIDYSDLIEYGRKMTEEKIIELKNNLNFLDDMQYEIKRSNSYNDHMERFHISKKYYYIEPLFEDEMNDNYYKTLSTLFTNVLNKNLLIKHSYGIIINMKNNKISSKFVAVEVNEKHKDFENVIRIDESDFLCNKTNEFNLNKICEIFTDVNNNDKTIIISNMLSYDFSNSYFEVKCSL